MWRSSGPLLLPYEPEQLAVELPAEQPAEPVVELLVVRLAALPVVAELASLPEAVLALVAAGLVEPVLVVAVDAPAELVPAEVALTVAAAVV